MTPLIITAAVNGSTKRARNPNVPLAPHEIVADALECMKAGAAIIHTHIEDYHMTGQVAADRYLESYRPIVQARPDAILCPSATIADTVELRWKYLEILAESGVMRMGTLDPGSLNIANSGENGLPGSYREVYCVPFPEIEYLLELHTRGHIGPVLSIYGPDHLHATMAYHRAGRMSPGALPHLYFAGDHNSMDMVKGGFNHFGLLPTRTGLEAYLEIIGDSTLPWSVAIPGGDVTGTGLSRLAIERGGHVRVGIEDYAGDDKPTNRQLVAQVVALAREIGRPIAGPREAAEILGLPRR